MQNKQTTSKATAATPVLGWTRSAFIIFHTTDNAVCSISDVIQCDNTQAPSTFCLYDYFQKNLSRLNLPREVTDTEVFIPDFIAKNGLYFHSFFKTTDELLKLYHLR